MKTKFKLIAALIVGMPLCIFAQQPEKGSFTLKVIDKDKTVLDTVFTGKYTDENVKSVITKYTDADNFKNIVFEKTSGDSEMIIETGNGKMKMMINKKTKGENLELTNDFSFTFDSGKQKGKYLFISEKGDTTEIGKSGNVFIIKSSDSGSHNLHSDEDFEVFSDNLDHLIHKSITVKSDGNKTIIMNCGENSDDKIWVNEKGDTVKIRKTIIISDGNETEDDNELSIISEEEGDENHNVKIIVIKDKNGEEHKEIIINSDKDSKQKHKMFFITEDGEDHELNKDRCSGNGMGRS